MPYHTSNKEKTNKPKNTFKKKSNAKITTLKQAIDKFNNMKDKPKANMKSSGKLSKRQSDLMKTHKEHHSNLHLRFMKYLMTNENYCFEISHQLAKDIIGK